MVKHLPTMQETQVQSLGREDPLEKEMATHSSTLAWKIPWTEDPGRLQSMASQRVRHDWATSLHFTSLHFRDYWWKDHMYVKNSTNWLLCFYNFLVKNQLPPSFNKENNNSYFWLRSFKVLSNQNVRQTPLLCVKARISNMTRPRNAGFFKNAVFIIVSWPVYPDPFCLLSTDLVLVQGKLEAETLTININWTIVNYEWVCN